MNLKRIIVLFLILTGFSLVVAEPLSVDLSLSYGLMYLSTNNDFFHNGIDDLMDQTDKNIYLRSSFKPKISCFYHNTGIYVSAEKPLDFNRFKRYWIISGGIVQRISISEKSALDFHLGTTWHSVNEAIHSFILFSVYTHYKSLLGLDASFRYIHAISENISIFAEANYNYNRHYNDTFESQIDSKFHFQMISLSVGVMYSLF